jgi:hypothetical protein
MIALQANRTAASHPYLRIVTGPYEEHEKAFLDRAKDARLAKFLPGKRWSDIGGDQCGLYANFAFPGYRLSPSIKPTFDGLVRELSQGWYVITEVLATPTTSRHPATVNGPRSAKWPVTIVGTPATRPDLACRFFSHVASAVTTK